MATERLFCGQFGNMTGCAQVGLGEGPEVIDDIWTVGAVTVTVSVGGHDAAGVQTGT